MEPVKKEILREEHERKVKETMERFGCLILTIVIGGPILFWAIVVYVALHFILKYW